MLDLGCGSGRLFRAFVDGGAARIFGIDGSRSLLARATERIAADDALRHAAAEGRVELVVGDVRRVARRDRFSLIVLAGVLAHLDGPEDATRALVSAGRRLENGGVLVVDTLGPGGLPTHDLPFSVDWERAIGEIRVVRRSRIKRREMPEGLRVDYATLTDLSEPDGTITRLPASFRLWYPSPTAIVALAAEADLDVVAAFGTHGLGPLDENSERCIVVLRRASRRASNGPGMG